MPERTIPTSDAESQDDISRALDMVKAKAGELDSRLTIVLDVMTQITHKLLGKPIAPASEVMAEIESLQADREKLRDAIGESIANQG